jgi:uncharacterized hydrophobic protein (TIGR00271 family)
MNDSDKKFIFIKIKAFLKERFSLDDDKANEDEIIKSIKAGVVFKGTNLWVLIFAILVASLGLNMNSAAVIIGAMLISPLMGPIMGIGLAIAINDFELMKKSLKNHAIAMAISIVTSTVYFYLSPLNEAQSEILARTTPTIWDVFIAFFGGLAGIIGATRIEKSNVVPGVAIATALMPPLCTAGFGLATGNYYYFVGALYLFFINSVFISLATFLIVKFLRFQQKEFVNKEFESKVKKYIYTVVIITIVPSIYLGYGIVKKTFFEVNSKKFLEQEFSFENTQIITKNIKFKNENDESEIELFLIGEKLDEKTLESIKKKMRNYKLENTSLLVKQGIDNKMDISSLKSDLLEDLFKRSEEQLKIKEQEINKLEGEIKKFKLTDIPVTDIAEELKAIYPQINTFSLSKSVEYNYVYQRQDTIYINIISYSKIPNIETSEKIENWIKKRIKKDNVKFIKL